MDVENPASVFLNLIFTPHNESWQNEFIISPLLNIGDFVALIYTTECDCSQILF